MPDGDASADAPDGPTPRRSLWDRFLGAILKPGTSVPPLSRDEYESLPADELEELNRRADDRERAIGLVAAPLGAVVAVLVSGALITDAENQHKTIAVYAELGGSLVVLSVLILIMALLRKRLLLGIVMALYGLAIFNLHYWGFGVPFVLAGAWYLVRSYRIQRAAREALSDDRRAPPQQGGPGAKKPQANKRYTPKTPPKRGPTEPPQ